MCNSVKILQSIPNEIFHLLKNKFIFCSTFHFFGINVTVKSTNSQFISTLNNWLRYFHIRDNSSADITLYPLIDKTNVRSPNTLHQWKAENTIYERAGEFMYLTYKGPPLPPWSLPPFRYNFHIIHGAAVSKNGIGLILPGSSGRGKSTLTLELVRNGFNFLTDELVIIDIATCMVIPYPRALCLSDTAVPLFPDLHPHLHTFIINGNKKWVLHPSDLYPNCIGEPCPVHYIIFHKYNPLIKTNLIEFNKLDATLNLMWHSLNRTFSVTHCIDTLNRLLEGTKCFYLANGGLKESITVLQNVLEL